MWAAMQESIAGRSAQRWTKSNLSLNAGGGGREYLTHPLLGFTSPRKVRRSEMIKSMKNFKVFLLFAVFAGMSLALQSCASITLPLTTTVFGSAQLAIKGTELQKELKRADVRVAFDDPFERAWNMSAIALVNLRIQVTKIGTTQEENGGLIEGRAGKTTVKIVAVELTENITEIGIWTEHNKALAELIAEKIREEVQKQSN
jgi:hypothetical protein